MSRLLARKRKIKFTQAASFLWLGIGAVLVGWRACPTDTFKLPTFLQSWSVHVIWVLGFGAFSYVLTKMKSAPLDLMEELDSLLGIEVSRVVKGPDYLQIHFQDGARLGIYSRYKIYRDGESALGTNDLLRHLTGQSLVSHVGAGPGHRFEFSDSSKVYLEWGVFDSGLNEEQDDDESIYVDRLKWPDNEVFPEMEVADSFRENCRTLNQFAAKEEDAIIGGDLNYRHMFSGGAVEGGIHVFKWQLELQKETFSGGEVRQVLIRYSYRQHQSVPVSPEVECHWTLKGFQRGSPIEFSDSGVQRVSYEDFLRSSMRERTLRLIAEVEPRFPPSFGN